MKRPLLFGEPAPWFRARALDGNPQYAFNSAAGRWIVMLFVDSAADPSALAALKLLAENRELFDDEHACFFGVTVDQTDAEQGRIAQLLPGIRWFLDYDGHISHAYGASSANGGEAAYERHWLVLDPMQRLHLRAPLSAGPEVIATVRQLSKRSYSLPAPVLVVPDVLSAQTCRRLIELYDENGGQESGFMREVDGITRSITDPAHKRRADYTIVDEKLQSALNFRLNYALRPMLQRAFQFDATRVERWIVACYDASEGGHFRAHRDNTTKGTAHRKFAVTINLDTTRHEGGDLRFPEFGKQTYRAPTGGAVVFSCSLLHEALPVTNGKRYAFLPFLYDEAGAQIREENLPFVAPEFQGYRSGSAAPSQD
jgi:predicted 2-oxoglutarate/Fe(II)-dependent dioxygenase YbiX/peroxiredoxin